MWRRNFRSVYGKRLGEGSSVSLSRAGGAPDLCGGVSRCSGRCIAAWHLAFCRFLSICTPDTQVKELVALVGEPCSA